MEEDRIIHNDVVYTVEEFNEFLRKQASKGSLSYLRYVGFGEISLIKSIFKCANFIKTHIKSYLKNKSERPLEGMPDEWGENEIIYLISSNLDAFYKSYQILFDIAEEFDRPEDLFFLLKKLDSVEKYIKDKTHLKTMDWIDYQYQNTLNYLKSVFSYNNDSNNENKGAPVQPITLYVLEPCDLSLNCCANITDAYER